MLAFYAIPISMNYVEEAAALAVSPRNGRMVGAVLHRPDVGAGPGARLRDQSAFGSIGGRDGASSGLPDEGLAMTPETSPDDPLRDAARLVIQAARSLAEGATGPDAAWYGSAARDLSAGLAGGPGRAEILAASPYVIERSGRPRTIVEMIEHEAGGDEARLRLARLLLRALAWEPARRELGPE
jgi:hypothetical protein